MALNKIKIISQAVQQNGLPAINTIDPNDKTSVAAEEAFDIIYPYVLSQCRWRFARKILELSKLVTPPAIETWKNAFQLPADWLANNAVIPNVDFDIVGRELYANVDSITLDYRFTANVYDAPVYFQMALIHALAEYLSLPYSEKTSFLSVFDMRMKKHFNTAAFLDSQNQPNKTIVNNPYINVRNGYY